MGNGAKAATKRERNAKDQKKTNTSQLKSNAAAKTIICKICRQDFQSTTKRPDLETHASNKHIHGGLRGKILLLVVFSACIIAVSAKTILTDKDVGQLTPEDIEQNIQKCAFAQSLAAHKVANAPETTSFTTKLFAYLFPSTSPAVNALLATAYISGPPNFLLALCPPNIDPASLSIMVAFAVGGLLGDTLFHLLPEIFLGEDEPDKVRFVVLEPNRNLLLGVGILVGIATFMAMDKALRIATGAGHSHSHEHNHSTPQITHGEDIDVDVGVSPNGKATGISIPSRTSSVDVTPRKIKSSNKGKQSLESNIISTSTTTTTTKTTTKEIQTTDNTTTNPSVKLAGLLNLIADFTHNITDGLALSTSFYTSPVLGATTTVAVFFHEIPHEVGDFALLIQSGFSKKKAMGAQFVTAVGAFLGTFIGIFVQEFGNSNNVNDSSGHSSSGGGGIWGTSLSWGDMLLPFTAGTFLYVGTVAVIPELLENGTGLTHLQETVRTLKQFAAMALGAAIMLGISWS